MYIYCTSVNTIEVSMTASILYNNDLSNVCCACLYASLFHHIKRHYIVNAMCYIVR